MQFLPAKPKTKRHWHLGEIRDVVTYTFVEDIAPYMLGDPAENDEGHTVDQGTAGAVNAFMKIYFNINLIDWTTTKSAPVADYGAISRFGDSFGSGHPSSEEAHKAHVQTAGLVAYWLYEAYKNGKMEDLSVAANYLSFNPDSPESNAQFNGVLAQLIDAYKNGGGAWRASKTSNDQSDATDNGEQYVIGELKIILASAARIAGWIMFRLNYNRPETGKLITRLQSYDPTRFNGSEGAVIYASEANMDDIDGWSYASIRDTWNSGTIYRIDVAAGASGDTVLGIKNIFSTIALIAPLATYLLYGKKSTKITTDKWRLLVDEFDYDVVVKSVGRGSAGDDPDTSSGGVFTELKPNPLASLIKKFSNRSVAQVAADKVKAIPEVKLPDERPSIPAPPAESPQNGGGGGGGGGGGTPESDNKGTIAVMVLLAVGVLGLLAYRKQSK